MVSETNVVQGRGVEKVPDANKRRTCQFKVPSNLNVTCFTQQIVTVIIWLGDYTQLLSERLCFLQLRACVGHFP